MSDSGISREATHVSQLRRQISHFVTDGSTRRRGANYNQGECSVDDETGETAHYTDGSH